ncbi:MAG: putative protease [Oleiphilaceae bacterium]|jgi:putative protease
MKSKTLNTPAISKYKPEVLAPVGNWDMCLAAVHNGAGAIYIGMPGFNARARSHDHSFEELKEIILYCRLYGVQVHVAFNILIFEKELPIAIEGLKQLLPLQPDAIICQDVGLVRIIKKMAPDQIVHASTQMTISSAEHIEFLSDLDMQRYVLARENSMSEMKNIRSKTNKELEVFVHGALCVAYSGQCLTSESMGGRSANRGQCAQTCRLDYQLNVNGKIEDLGAQKYLVSPKDLFGVDEIAGLMDLKIDSFKIEGRYKPPEYVAAASKLYSEKINEVLALPHEQVSSDALKISFSRDFFSGWLNGVNHNELVGGRYSSHRGLKTGHALSIKKDKKYPTVKVFSSLTIHPGDGLFFVDTNEQMLFAARAYDVEKLDSDTYMVNFEKGSDLSKLSARSLMYINRSPARDKLLQQSYTDKSQLKRIPIAIRVDAVLGEPLRVVMKDDQAHEISVATALVLSEAQNSPLDDAKIRKHFKALSGSVFVLGRCDINIEPGLFIQDKAIKKLRQLAVAQLEAARLQRKFNESYLGTQASEIISSVARKYGAQAATVDELFTLKTSNQHQTKLNILVRDDAQIDALVDLSSDVIGTVYLDYKYGQQYEKSVDKIRALGFRAGIVTTRVFKAGREKLLGIINRIQPDVVLVRNAGAFEYFKQKYNDKMPFELVGDFSFNITNHLSAQYFLNKGLSVFSPSYDLNFQQLEELLLSRNDGGTDLAVRAEITIHQYMPSFHMEHCVFASFLSDGSSIKDCGMPCVNNNVGIVDNKNINHPVLADQECRNTMFNGVPQSAGSMIPKLLSLGVKHYRIEALTEDADVLREKVVAYMDVLSGESDAKALYKNLGIIEKYGISEGQQQNLDVYSDRKKISKEIPVKVI